MSKNQKNLRKWSDVKNSGKLKNHLKRWNKIQDKISQKKLQINQKNFKNQ